MRLLERTKRILRISMLFVSAAVLAIGQAPLAKADVFYTVSGTFTDRSGNPVSNVQLNLDSPANGSMNFTTDSNGQYSVNVVPDVISIHAYSSFNHNGVPFSIDLSDGVGTIDASNGNVTQDLQLDTVALDVNFVDQSNNPVPNAQVTVTATNAGDTTLLVGHPQYTFTPSSWRTGSLGATDVNGAVSTTVLRGIVYRVCVVDPATSVNVCNNYTPTSDSSTVTLTAPVLNTVSGTFTDRSGNPVNNAHFAFNSTANGSINFTTDSSGHYSVDVVPDVLTLSTTGSGFSHNGVPFTIDLSAGSGTVDASAGDIVQDLQLDTIALDVNFVDGNNVPIPNAQTTVTATNSGSTTLLVGHPEFTFAPSSWRTGSIAATDVSGSTQTTVIRGLRYQVCAVDPSTSSNVCSLFIPTDDTTTVTLTAPVLNTVSGTFTDRSGNPVVNATFNLNSAANGPMNFTTDSNGQYSVDVSPDVLTIQPSSGFSHVGIPYQVDLSGNSGTIDASNGDVTQDLQLDTVALDVSFLDENNSPIPNAQVTVTATNAGATTLLVGHPEFTFAPSSWHTGALASTDINGLTSTTVLRGIIHQVCAVDPSSSLQYCKTYTPNDDVNTVVISQGIAAPTGLVAQSNITNQSPVLTWNAVGGADHYDVYRDGNVVGSPTTASFTDSNVTDGSHDYYVKAVTSGNVTSNPSNTVTVVYDSTNPLVSHTLSLAANTFGWHNTDVTVTFDCSDTLTLVVSCTSPVTVTTEGAGQQVVGTAVDEAGNTGTDTVTLNIDKTDPTITPNPDQAPNVNSWNNTDVTVSFDCNDALSGVQSCTSPVLVNTEGAGQVVNGTAVDLADNSAGTSTTLNVDKTAPTLTDPTWNQASTLVGQDATLSTQVSDGLSGVSSVVYSVDGGTPQLMTYVSPSDTWQATFGSTLPVGTYMVDVTVFDNAGNTSTKSEVLVIYDLANGYVSGNAKTVPTASDTLPIALDTSNNPAKLTAGVHANSSDLFSTSFDVSYVVTPANKKKDAFQIDSTSVDWVQVQPTSNQASLQGTADLTTWVNGIQTTTIGVKVQFHITFDASGNATHILIEVFNPGVNPVTGTPVYVIDDDVIANGSNLALH